MHQTMTKSSLLESDYKRGTFERKFQSCHSAVDKHHQTVGN